jgi:hypothetical protein
MPDQDYRRAEVQRLQHLVEVASRRLGSDWRRWERRALAVAAPIVDEDAGKAVQGVKERR